MHILIASDSYKGSLSARQVCDILAQALLTHPGVTVPPCLCPTEARDLAPAALTPVRALSFTKMPLTYMVIQYKHPCTPGAIRR